MTPAVLCGSPRARSGGADQRHAQAASANPAERDEGAGIARRARMLQMGMSEREDWNRKIIEEFRTNAGKVGAPFEGVPILLLHHRGAKTGTERINPLAYRRDGDNLVIFASKAGAPTNPDWYHNLVANPEAVVEVGTGTGTEEIKVRA